MMDFILQKDEYFLFFCHAHVKRHSDHLVAIDGSYSFFSNGAPVRGEITAVLYGKDHP